MHKLISDEGVVRYEDDTNRVSGKIESDHGKQ